MNREAKGLIGVTALSLMLSACAEGPAPAKQGETLPTPTPIAESGPILPTPTVIFPQAPPPPEPTQQPPSPPTDSPPPPTATETPRQTEVIASPDYKLVNEKGEVLKGSVITPFAIVHDKRPRNENVRRVVDNIINHGGNAAIVTLNAAGFDNENYVRDLASVLRYGRDKGIDMILSIYSNGEVFDQEHGWYVATQLTTVDQNLKDYWRNLLTDPTYGAEIINNTSAFILLQEPGEYFNWSRDIQYYIETTTAIRQLTGKDTPVSLAGGYWARRFGDLLTMGSAPLPNMLLNASPYYEFDHSRGEEFLGQVDALRAKGWTPIISELGYKMVKTGDTYDDVVRRVGIARAQGLAYFMWDWDGEAGDLYPLLR